MTEIVFVECASLNGFFFSHIDSYPNFLFHIWLQIANLLLLGSEGHYLSASAHMWASTHNDTLKEKMSAVVSALSHCQKKIGSGYLSGFPSRYFDHLEALKPVWAPYYTIHKVKSKLLASQIGSRIM